LVHEVLPVCRRDSSNSYPISFETNDLSRVKLSGVSSVSGVQKNLTKPKGRPDLFYRFVLEIQNARRNSVLFS